MIKPNNKWSGVVILGGDKNQKFDIHFILTDDHAHTASNDYLTDGSQKNYYPEKTLPSGTKSLGYLTITKE